VSRSLRGALTWRLLLCFIVLWGLIGAAWYLVVRQAWTAEWDAELSWLAKESCYLLPEGGGLPPLAASAEALQFSDPDSGLYFEIWDQDLLFSDRSPSLAEHELPIPASFPTEPVADNVQLSNGERLRMLAQEVRIPMAGGGSAPARFNVAVARERGPLDRRLRQLLVTIGSAFLGALLLTVLFIRLSIRRAFRPLQALENQIGNIDASSLDQRLDLSDVPEEVEPMVVRFNGLLERVSKSFERESRFTSDVAHELRTPVSELTLLAEVRLKWPDHASPEDNQEFLRIGKHMKRQIETLLAMARLDQGQESVVSKEIDLVDLVETHWEPLAATADSRQLKVSLPVRHATVEGDPELFAIIVRNLLENAVEYSPEGGELHVRVGAAAAPVVIVVENQVDNPQNLDTEAMFDRFWRADGARSGGGHSGLGLALCRSSAAAMGLKMVADLDRTRGVLAVKLVNPAFETSKK